VIEVAFLFYWFNGFLVNLQIIYNTHKTVYYAIVCQQKFMFSLIAVWWLYSLVAFRISTLVRITFFVRRV